MVKFPILACVICGSALSALAGGKTDAAVAAAGEWLALVDAEEYGRSWEQAAPYFKEQVGKEQWVGMIAAVRGPLGKAVSRKLAGTHFAAFLPGAPEGEYVVIQFKTDFADKPGSVETVTPMLVDGEWRVSGYFIK